MIARIAFAALALAACFPPNGQEDDTRGGKHKLTVSWSIKNADGSVAGCPAGFQDLLISVTNMERTAQEQQMAPCASTGTHELEIYTSGELRFMMPDDASTYIWRYTENQEVIVYITDPTGENVRARNIMVPVKLDADKSVDVAIYPDAGFAIVKWELRSGITSSFVSSCPAVELDAIEYRYRDFDNEQAPIVIDRWPCMSHDPDFPYLGTFDVGSGRTRALKPGNYIGTLVGIRGVADVAKVDEVSMAVRMGADVSETTGGELVVPDR